MPSIPGFLRPFVPSSTGLPILPMTGLRPRQRATAELARAGTPQHPGTATSHSSLKLGQPAARTVCRLTLQGKRVTPLTKQSLLIFRHRRLATVKRIDQHPREENLTKLPRITYRRSFLQLIARCVAALATPVVVADSGWFRSRVEDSLADPVASATA